MLCCEVGLLLRLKNVSANTDIVYKNASFCFNE